MENKDKIILDLCGGTGSWSKPYRDAGYDVRLITLPDYDVSDVVFSSDYMVFNKQNYKVNDQGIEYGCIYGILAAPPCTEFSLAKNGAKTPRNLDEGLITVNACQKIIWEVRKRRKLAFWAMENPIGLLRQFIGVPAFTFRQWEFGDPGVKPTDIWGYFKHPKKTTTQPPDGITRRYKSGKVNAFAWAAPKSPEWLDKSGLTRADLRSMTPPGFAQAFFKANQ